jgi:hypothetical protein
METGIEETAVVQAEAAATSTELVLREADSLAITSDADFQAAAVTLREVKSHWKDLDDQRKEFVRPIQEAERRINDKFRGPLEYLARAERVLKDKIGAYKEEQDRLAQLEQARLDEEARVAAQKLADKAEKARLAGHYEKAAALEGAADSVAAAEAPPPPKAYGTYTRETWSAVVEDEVALIQAVAAGTVPSRAITVNMAFLHQQARSLKSDLNYPGVRAKKETSVSASTGIRDQRALPRR